MISIVASYDVDVSLDEVGGLDWPSVIVTRRWNAFALRWAMSWLLI